MIPIPLWQKIKCLFGFHIFRIALFAAQDRYHEPWFYCLGCDKTKEPVIKYD